MMSAGTFWEELKLPEGSGIDVLEQRFLEVIKEHIQAVAETYDEQAVAAEEQWLRRFHGQFFQYVRHWAHAENQQPAKPKEHPDAVKLKIEAQTTIGALEENIIEFALCYMHLNRFLTLLRDEIKREETMSGLPASKNLKWTSDTGIAIRRYKKQKRQILEAARRMKEMEPILEEIDDHLGEIRRAMTALQSKEKADALLRSLTAALRTSNLTRARKLVREAAAAKKRFGLDQKGAADLQKKLETAGGNLISITGTQSGLLLGADGKLFLRPAEVSLARDAGMHDLRKIRGFLAKYHLPYMQHKVDTLFHLKDKLLVVGSLEGLMTLYKKLIMGIALPLEDIKAVRCFENEVLDRVKYLLETQFQEVPKIHERARETVEEFRTGCAEFEEMQKMPLPSEEDAGAKVAEAIG